ncbi:hypothetical protein CNE_2c04750 [Cupriavidus necator N-1]|jgi:hypothetical protein|uniref:Lipoprotein n=1 Tax=Cupriavidus necator (strain ATCC 43291 / DSM 13513 / CCUG 52238 / LMG 8453 / N-1) TaxID=1042878 RepID=F8GQI4_CUPNN|nr:hypothetical protein [Cupriavidus necator]AEI79456.1 hypothetical protein CNE_2c04750 [Cupriavidus necator N-1]KAI3601830.1 hypothetical protein D8I24_3615 [Cupriavidus necator H850]
MRPSLLSRSARPWLAAGTLTLALMLTACGGDDSPGASGSTLQPTAANGNKPDQPGKPDRPGTCTTRCAP